jgi:hypothetical protein
VAVRRRDRVGGLIHEDAPAGARAGLAGSARPDRGHAPRLAAIWPRACSVSCRPVSSSNRTWQRSRSSKRCVASNARRSSSSNRRWRLTRLPRHPVASTPCAAGPSDPFRSRKSRGRHSSALRKPVPPGYASSRRRGRRPGWLSLKPRCSASLPRDRFAHVVLGTGIGTRRASNSLSEVSLEVLTQPATLNGSRCTIGTELYEASSFRPSRAAIAAASRQGLDTRVCPCLVGAAPGD